jgi:hypothetical protein
LEADGLTFRLSDETHVEVLLLRFAVDLIQRLLPQIFTIQENSRVNRHHFT